MSGFVLCLVLGAAVLHATWNAMLRSSGDRFLSIVTMDVAAALVCLPFAFVLPIPLTAAWPYILLSASIHVGYSLFLCYLYKHGELGLVYPIARGSSPLLVALGGLVFANEQLHGLTIAGIILVSCGIIALAKSKSKDQAHIPPKLAMAAFTTGCVIASYTVVDGIGARLSGNTNAYSVWMFLIYGVLMVPLYLLGRGKRIIRLKDPNIHKSALGGVLGLIGYTVIIWAVSISPMGPVSALRETSVVFAALIGRFFLKEKLTPQRMAACIVIACGAACLT